MPGHPLTRNGRSRQFEHRVVLYDKIGPGTHPCYHCSIPVTWHIDLQTDHIDEDKTNNDPSNVVPTCRTCNTWRSQYPETFAARLTERRLAVTCGARHEANAELRELGLIVGQMFGDNRVEEAS